jgi:DNA-binding NarL/FixJ family response regulator
MVDAAMGTQTRVLIADDHPVIRKGLRGIFESDPSFNVTDEAASGREAERLAHSSKPDLVILDIRLGDVSGIDVAKRIRSSTKKNRGAQPVILMCSMYSPERYVADAIDAKANGFVAKDQDPDSMVGAAKDALADREAFFAPGYEQLAEDYASSERSPLLNEEESVMLDLIAQGKTMSEITEAMTKKFGRNYSESQVKHRSSLLYRKFGTKRATVALLEARRAHYID